MKLFSWLGHLAVEADQLSAFHTLPCVDDKRLKARVERLAPRVGDADKASVSLAVIADCCDDAAVRRDDSLVGYHLKVDAIVAEECFGAYDKAAVVLRPGPPRLDDAPPAFKRRRQVDAFRFVTSVFDCALNKVEGHRLGEG